MAELFGVASGALSVAGFAGQLAQSAAFLHDFFKDIKNAPKTVQRISEELCILTSILIEIQKSYNIHDAELRNSLQHCGKRLDEVVAFIKNIDPAQYEQKRLRLWSQCKVALKRSDLMKYLAELDRCTLMLVQACNNISRAEQTFQTNHITSIFQQTQDLTAKQQLSATVSGAVQATVQEIRHISSDLQSTTRGLTTITQEVKLKMDQTNTGMSQIHDNIELIRTMTERIESAQQTLENNTLGNRAASLKTLKKEMDRTIARSLKRHLREHFESPIMHQENRPRVSKDTGDRLQSTLTSMETADQSHDKEFVCSSPVPIRTPREWIRVSSTETQQFLTQNSLLGITHIRTITVTYNRHDNKGNIETKQIITTVLSYLPPPWLTSRGAILRRQHLFRNYASNKGVPHWTLSTVNVIDEGADIIQACWQHDLDKIRKLFDHGLASPYDVDRRGRNLIGYVTAGVRFYYFRGKHETLRNRLDDFNSILELLLGYGVDAGHMDIEDFTPIFDMLAAWYDAYEYMPSVSSEDDYMNYLFSKLLSRAKTDPFSGSEALLDVAPYEGFHIFNFPGLNSDSNYGYKLSLRQIDVLLGQTEWPLTWDSQQLQILSSARYHSFEEVSGIRHHIAFWVTSQAEDISRYLYTKLDLLEKIISHGTLALKAEHAVVKALYGAIHEGGWVITILTRHLYCSCFPGRKPWIRHRFKKLVIIEKWLTEIFRLLLTKVSAHVANAVVLEEMYQFARAHNARTLGAWTKALKACGHDHARDTGSVDNATSVDDATSDQTGAHSEWETDNSGSDDGSDWETEEELDEGQLFQLVKDRHCTDATNPDLKGKSRHTCDVALHEYDEEYWSHLYPHIMESFSDPVLEEEQEGITGRLTRYASNFIAATNLVV